MHKSNPLSKFFTKSYWNAQTILEAGVFLLVVAQFLFLIYLNLFCCKKWIDHDASMLYAHTMEMWKRKMYILPFFEEETFLHLDTSCILAMPLYGLLHDVFLAYGIANVIFMAFTAWVIWDILKNQGTTRVYRLVALLLYLIPYRMGMLQYTTMLFFECSFYNVCVLVPLISIDLYCYPSNKEHGFRYYSLIIINMLLTFLTAFSRGTFTLLLGLLPIFLCYTLDVILSKEGFKHIRRSKVIVTSSILLSYFSGLLYEHVIHALPRVSGYSLVPPKNLFDNFIHVIWGHMSIFVDRETPEVMSFSGIHMLVMHAFSLFALIMIVFGIRHAFTEGKDSSNMRYAIMIYLWSCCICGLTAVSESEFAFPERYLFPGIIPVFLVLPFMLTGMEMIERKLLRNTLYLGIGSLILLTVFFSDHNVLSSFETNRDTVQGIKEVIAFAQDNGIDTVFFLNDKNEGGHITRTLAPSIKTAPLNFQKNGNFEIITTENYLCAADRAYYSDVNMIAVPWEMQPEDLMPEYLRSSYQFAADVEDYHLYLSGENKYDYRNGFPMDDGIMNESIDFCYTEGYQSTGEIDLYGYLETIGNGNYDLISPLLNAPFGTSDVVLNYETGLKVAGVPNDNQEPHSMGSLQILDASLTPVSTTDIMSDQLQAVITTDYLAPCYIAVFLNENEAITLQNVHFYTNR